MGNQIYFILRICWDNHRKMNCLHVKLAEDTRKGIKILWFVTHNEISSPKKAHIRTKRLFKIRQRQGVQNFKFKQKWQWQTDWPKICSTYEHAREGKENVLITILIFSGNWPMRWHWILRPLMERVLVSRWRQFIFRIFGGISDGSKWMQLATEK